MRIFVEHDEVIGCVTFRPDGPSSTWIEHFYIEPAHQGRGLGSLIMGDVTRAADSSGVTLRLAVLRESHANRFYQRHGFAETHREEWDVYYERLPLHPPS